MFLALANIILLWEEIRWWDYPGFELWKFINLAIFVPLLIWAVNRFLGFKGFLRERKVQIRRDLERAKQERDDAVAKLKEVEERLARLDSEVATIQKQSRREAGEERERIARATETEVAKLSEQAQRDIEGAGKAAKHDLRRFAAERSVALAEEMIRRELRPDDDARLIDRNINELGGAA